MKKSLAPGVPLQAFFVQAFSSPPSSSSPLELCNAQIRFAESLAAYSIFNYLMAVKDRHNGNIMLRSDGASLHRVIRRQSRGAWAFAPVSPARRRCPCVCVANCSFADESLVSCAVLCCAVLCCAVLCCAVLCCAVLCCAVLCVRACVPHAGVLVHIDFGFVLGQAPGGRFSLERAPFKLTAEMGAVLGGPTSSLWVRA